MTLTILSSSKDDPSQDRVEIMLRWLHNIPEYEKSPIKSEFLEDRQWADDAIAYLRQKYQMPKMADAKEPLDEMLASIKRTAALYHKHQGALMGTSATANSNDMQRERDEKFDQLRRKITAWVATLEDIERETQKARDNVFSWCENRRSRAVPSLFQQIIGSPDYALAEIAIRKFFERRGEISDNPKSDCFEFTQLFGEAVKNQKLSSFALLNAHRDAYQKIKAEQEGSRQ